MTRLRVACAGTGYFSQFQYEAWHRMDDVELVGLYNRSPGPARETAEKWDVPNVFDDFAEMLSTVQPDVVDIITPPVTHLDFIRQAAARGIPVICQKPFCQSLDEARQAVALADAAGIALIIHENFRFQPWYTAIKAQIDAGRLGDLYQITFRLRPGDGQGPDAYLGRQPYFQQMERFLVHETAIHQIDTFRYLMGPIVETMADLRQINPAIKGEDAGLILFTFENGARGLFDGNRLVDHPADNPRLTMGEMLIEGSKGTLTLDGFGTVRFRGHGEKDWQPVTFDWHDRNFGGDCVYLTQRHAADALLGKTAPVNTGSDYLANVMIEEAVYQSAAQNKRVKL